MIQSIVHSLFLHVCNKYFIWLLKGLYNIFSAHYYLNAIAAGTDTEAFLRLVPQPYYICHLRTVYTWRFSARFLLIFRCVFHCIFWAPQDQMKVWKMQQKMQGMGSGPILSEKCCVINSLIKRSKNATCKQSLKALDVENEQRAYIVSETTSDWLIKSHCKGLYSNCISPVLGACIGHGSRVESVPLLNPICPNYAPPWQLAARKINWYVI